jgi:aminodeoxyfutalosine synthase
MSTSALDDIAARLAAGEPIGDPEAARLAATDDIISLGMVADERRRAAHGNRTTFVRVAAVALAAAAEAPVGRPAAAREIRLSGSFESIERATAAVRHAVEAAGDVPVSGFSLAELEAAASGDEARLRDWLASLRDAGLALVDHVVPERLQSPEITLRAVVECGLSLGRCLVESADAARTVSRLRRVADLQAATGAVRIFAPIPRQRGPEPTTGYADVKAVALARLLLPEVPHIQVDWTLHGPKLAQVALTFGADDLDNVSPVDDASEGRRRATLEEVRRNIVAAGFEPIARDARFSRVE